jgi:amidase
VVGIKPTVGLVSRSGVIPISHTQDTAGPFATTVRDAAILLGAMAGPDPRDEATARSRGRLPADGDYAAGLDAGALRGARIGVPREELAGFTAESDRIFEEVLAALEDAGAVLVDPADLPHVGEYGDAEYTVLLYEFKDGLNRYLAARRAETGAEGGSAGGGARGRDSLPRDLADLIRFNEENRAREMPYFGQDIFERAQEKGSLREDEYREALERILRLSREEGIDRAFEEHRLDAMVAVTSAPPWPIDLVNGDRGHGSSYSAWAIAGYPGITLPAGYAFGLPVGVSFYGRPWEEPKLLAYAHAFEAATRVRRAPGFAPAADVPV